MVLWLKRFLDICKLFFCQHRFYFILFFFGDRFDPTSLVVVQVGFESLALRVSSIELGTCEARVMRVGLFGDITVQWKAGHPSGGAPPGISPGSGKKKGLEPREWLLHKYVKREYAMLFCDVLLSSPPGSLLMAHGERTKAIPLAAVADRSELVSYAIHLTGATSHTGSAKLRYRTG